MTTAIRGARKSTENLLSDYFTMASQEVIGLTPRMTAKIDKLEQKIRARKQQEQQQQKQQ